jgi:hypothetical protein
MRAHITALMIFATATLTSCASYVAPEVSGPYAARLTREDIQQIAALPFTGSGINRGVHSIYAKSQDHADVQSGLPKWPNDTIVSFSVRKKAGHWAIVPDSISTMRLIPTG